MDGIKESELLRELSESKEKIRVLEDENMKLKIAMEDYGIVPEDLEEIPDAEVIAIKQLELLRTTSDSGINFTKEEADIFKVLTNALMSIRGGTIKRQKKTPKGKDADADELLAQYNKLQVMKGGKS